MSFWAQVPASMISERAASLHGSASARGRLWMMTFIMASPMRSVTSTCFVCEKYRSMAWAMMSMQPQAVW